MDKHFKWLLAKPWVVCVKPNFFTATKKPRQSVSVLAVYQDGGVVGRFSGMAVCHSYC
ncbi:hypothetical protein GCM10009720_14420 [Yaniella flava]|uniref:Uncharacterized protein n=1 Tax=Yaniella flava TaxID=287930 RepID=A0ABP5FVD7_9MICC